LNYLGLLKFKQPQSDPDKLSASQADPGNIPSMRQHALIAL
jgi:hypothetical protein